MEKLIIFKPRGLDFLKKYSFKLIKCLENLEKLMTKLGLYLTQKSVNKSEVARKTGLSKARISELSLNPTTRLQAEELYKIALAIDVNPCELLEALYGELKLKKK